MLEKFVCIDCYYGVNHVCSFHAACFSLHHNGRTLLLLTKSESYDLCHCVSYHCFNNIIKPHQV